MIDHTRADEGIAGAIKINPPRIAGSFGHYFEFLGRWMKARHFPRALAHDPWYVLRHATRMFRHTFRGCTWRTLVGLEDERVAFRRYRALRRQEREYLADEPEEAPASITTASAAWS